MNTQQIEALLKRDPYTKNIFKKVCARDQVEKPIFPSAYIINSDPSNMPGEHWVAVYFDKKCRGEYFDSYGLPPDVLHLEIYMNQHSSTNWIYNNKKIFTSFIFNCLWSLLCVFCFISLSWKVSA